VEDERRGDAADRRQMRKRLDEIEEGYKKRADSNRKLIEKFGHRTGIMLAMLAVIQLGLGVLSISLVVQNGHQQDRIGGQQRLTSRQQQTIAGAVRAIQQQRAEATWDSCRTQNYHHDLTVRRLRDLVSAIKNPSRRLRAENNTAGTVSLIDALTPVQNCKLLLAERLHVKGKALDRLTHRLEAELGPMTPPKR
jgi:tetrahydromethanopterin S-methyltransferase subunit G